jgi:DNA-binding HxlR family transcriptional regulator
MLGNTYDRQACSIARTLEVVGERWTLLILRDAVFAGLTRFSDFQRSLGIATNGLRDRLDRLVADGILRREPYSDEAAQYLPTEKGRALVPALVALTAWGDEWAAPDGAPIVYRRPGCDGVVHPELRCEHGDPVAPGDLLVDIGPGMTEQRLAEMDAIRSSRARDPRLVAPAS